MRACWSRQGRGRGRGWWLLFRTVSFRPTRDPSSARSRRASASSLLSSAATKAGSFWPPWHMMTTEATTTTTKNRLLACTAVAADCRMVHIGGARCRAAPSQCASPAAASARWPGNYWRAGGGRRRAIAHGHTKAWISRHSARAAADQTHQVRLAHLLSSTFGHFRLEEVWRRRTRTAARRGVRGRRTTWRSPPDRHDSGGVGSGPDFFGRHLRWGMARRLWTAAAGGSGGRAGGSGSGSGGRSGGRAAAEAAGGQAGGR